jgi:hypothetical protein
VTRLKADAFRQTAESEFAFLGDLGFTITEAAGFSVSWASEVARVVVRGTNWGQSVRVAVGGVGGPFEDYDLIDILELRCAGELRLWAETRGDQPAKLRFLAAAIRRCEAAAAVLRGDFALFPELHELVARRDAHYASLRPTR